MLKKPMNPISIDNNLYLLLFQYHEFEISDSQEPTQDDEAPARKRKASIASEAILV